MKVILFGATGMVGQAVLRECLLDPEVESVVAVGRSPTERGHDKLRELVVPDLSDLSAVEEQLSGYDACFFCIGISSAGMTEQDYRRVTYDLTMAVATTLARRNPGMTFVFVSGAGADSSEQGRVMWARVKGAAENAVLRLPFKATYVFRPAFIQAMHGITSRTTAYRVVYALVGPLYPLWKALFPEYVTTTEQIGHAMLTVARQGAPKRVLESDDINRL
ncbi:MAG TPA: NAD(P)H-binding protein [Vicinamibacteria bacterium]